MPMYGADGDNGRGAGFGGSRDRVRTAIPAQPGLHLLLTRPTPTRTKPLCSLRKLDEGP